MGLSLLVPGLHLLEKDTLKKNGKKSRKNLGSPLIYFMEKGYIRVPLAVVLSFVNGRHSGADLGWFRALYWVRRSVAGRYSHLKGFTLEDFPGNSWVKLPSYYLVEDFNPARTDAVDVHEEHRAPENSRICNRGGLSTSVDELVALHERI
jgi:hypothetical protein